MFKYIDYTNLQCGDSQTVRLAWKLSAHQHNYITPYYACMMMAGRKERRSKKLLSH